MKRATGKHNLVATNLKILATTGTRLKNDNEPNKVESLAPKSRDPLWTLFRGIPNTLRTSRNFQTNDDKKLYMNQNGVILPQSLLNQPFFRESLTAPSSFRPIETSAR
tara:strand:+ start:223 stop:546 length:324 start_codon:yes stop_codon:yes gene_type:complete